jgi:hypothetical protein
MKEQYELTSKIRQDLGPFPDWALPYLKGGCTEKINDSQWMLANTIDGVKEIEDGDFIVKEDQGISVIKPNK